MNKPRILYIDDEKENLNLFRQIFYMDYEVFISAGGKEALHLLEREEEMAIVVTDQLMTGMSGTEVLSEVAEQYPDTTRMIITAYSDPSIMLDSINQGHVYRYILKPWDDVDLRSAIKNGAEKYALTKKNQHTMTLLQGKTEELELLNKELEKRVRKRTVDLAKANRLLALKIKELEDAMAEIKELKGLLPICCYCKKIRDDQDYWEALEPYLEKHSDITFTHGICPECYEKKLKPEMQEALARKAKGRKKDS